MDDYVVALKRELKAAIDCGLTSLAVTIRAELDRVTAARHEHREATRGD